LNGTNVSIPNNLNFDSNTLLIDATNDRVGIGTNAPDQKLHVLKGSAGSVTAETGSIAVFEGSGNNHITILTPDDASGGVVFGSPSDNYGSYLTWNHNNNELKLATANPDGFIQLATNNEADAVRITSTGNVGIGTTVPAERLTVNGNISARDAVIAYSLSGRYLGLVHNPANDGIDPSIRLGETGSAGFSGVFISYNESTNMFGLSSLFSPSPAVGALSINHFGNIGVKTNDVANALTVNGAISASQGITVGTRTSLPGISAATLVHATTALTLSITDIFLKINIGGTDYALPLYNYTT
jgi:hypothetical protein